MVGDFHAIDRIVQLTVFSPVLPRQCRNSGSQALAVTLRGITLNELKPGHGVGLMVKEALIEWWNGSIVGSIAGAVLDLMAVMQRNSNALTLALSCAFAMALSCLRSGIAGAAISLGSQRLGADPVTGSAMLRPPRPTSSASYCSLVSLPGC